MSDYAGPVNPYDPTLQNSAPETPTLAQVILEANRQHALATRVALPAVVKNVRGNQLVDLQPTLTAKYVNDVTVPLPIIPCVPVVMPTGASYSLKFPIAVGDMGLCLFSDRSLDKWLASSGTELVNPDDYRAHDLNDGIFVPGLVPIAQQTQDATNDVVLTHGLAQLRLGAAGTFKFANATCELVSLTCQLAQATLALSTTIGAATVASTTTLQGPVAGQALQTAITAQETAVQNILVQLLTLKG